MKEPPLEMLAKLVGLGCGLRRDDATLFKPEHFFWERSGLLTSFAKRLKAEPAHTRGHLAASLGVSRPRFLGVILAGHIVTWQPPFLVFLRDWKYPFGPF